MTRVLLHATLDAPTAGPVPVTRRARCRAALGRRHGPLVRLWSADMTLLHTEPAQPEPILRWLARAPRRLVHASKAR